MAAPVLVYNATLAANQTRATFAWLMLPSSSSQVPTASVEVLSTGDGDATVQLRVTVDGRSHDKYFTTDRNLPFVRGETVN